MVADPLNINHEDRDEELPSSPGAILRQARNKAGCSEREAAQALRLLPYQIRCLEQNEFESFNSAVFCKAHLKAYAKFLSLDGENLIKQYQQMTPAVESDTAFRHVAKQQIQQPARGSSFRYWSLAVVAVVSVMLWVTQRSHENPEEATAAIVVDSNDQSNLRALEASLSKAELSTDAEVIAEFSNQEQDSVVINLPAGGKRNVSEAALDSAAFREDGAMALRSIPADSMAVASLTEDTVSVGTDVLKFEFADDCWVEVKDGRGDVIFASLKHAQESLELTGAGPFKVLLGYAHGVNIDYNGQPVEISVNQRNNSARLVVGNLSVN